MRIKLKYNINCYIAKNLNEISKILDMLRYKNAHCSKLFYKSNTYYILSDKSINTAYKINSNFIGGLIEEHATLISDNAINEVLNLL